MPRLCVPICTIVSVSVHVRACVSRARACTPPRDLCRPRGLVCSGSMPNFGLFDYRVSRQMRVLGAEPLKRQYQNKRAKRSEARLIDKNKNSLQNKPWHFIGRCARFN